MAEGETKADLALQDGLPQAVRLREAGRLDEARRALEGLLQAAGDEAPTLAALAHVQLALGELATAETTARRLDALAPGSAHACRTGARVAAARGAGDDALALARRAVEAAPADPDNGAFLAALLVSRGERAAAAALLGELLSRSPDHTGARVVQADLASVQGDHAAAAQALAAALAAKPHLPLWSRLGRLRLALGEAEGARQAFAAALAATPNDAVSRTGLAEALRRLGRPAEAEAVLRTLLADEPANAAAWSNLGVVLLALNRRGEAVEVLRRALALDPNSHGAHLNLATALNQEGRPEAAAAAARAAVALRPDLAAGHVALASALDAARRGPEAEAAWRRALELDPNSVAAREGLAAALAEQGETTEAAALLEDLARRTGGLEHLLAAGMAQPVIPASRAEIDQARARCRAALAAALDAPLRFRNPERAPPTFQLAYQGLDDRGIMQALDAALSARAPELSHVAALPPLPRGGRRLRVGFASQLLYNHTVGRVFKGLLQRLDRARFEVVVAHLPRSRRDAVRAEIDAAADRVLELPADLPGQRAALTAAELDVLVFPDIGMTPASYLLARSRLARVQAVGWGHPDTTGLSTVDYYVSWDRAEPLGAEAHYAERLVRLPRLACYYEPPTPPAPATRAAAGLPASGALYGCLQSLFKLHPDFDAVLAEIVRRDPDGWLVFAEGPYPQWEAKLRRRWAQHPGLNARAVFIPHRPLEAYLATLGAMDVLLDPPHFGSGNTFYDAMVWGVPVVTWPGAFARGRIVAAAYAQMGAGGELIAPRLGDYASLAVAVAHGSPQDRRAELRAAARAELFADLAAVRAFEDFLLGAVEASTAPNGSPRPPVVLS